MKHEKQYKVCWFECDVCGIASPNSLSWSEARAAMREAGWEIEETWNGLNYVTRHLCPDCRTENEISVSSKPSE